MNSPKITIGVILFTGCEKYLLHSLPSLLNQDYKEVEILLRDQSPHHTVYDWLKKNMPEVFEKAIVETGENLRHCGGHNVLIGKMTGDYYFCMSNDMWYPSNFISQVLDVMEKEENIKYGSATVKLMHWDFEKVKNGDPAASKTNTIDSVGIGIKPTHHFTDLGQGEKDQGQYDDRKSIFGGSGGCLILRKSTLETIRYKDEYFDKLLHYKGDVDLAYRLQWAGQKCLFLRHIKVWHDRQVSGKDGMLGCRKKMARWAKEDSYFGHLVTLKKNYTKKFSLKIRLKTFMFNVVKFVYTLVFEPYLLKQYRRLRQCADEIEAKRKAIKRVATPEDIENLMR